MIRVMPLPSNTAAAVLLIGTTAGCGATKLGDAEWHSRVRALAQNPQATGEVGSEGLLEGELKTWTRTRWALEVESPSGPSRHWTMTIDGPKAIPETFHTVSVVRTSATTVSGRPTETERTQATATGALLPGSITVQDDNGSITQSPAQFALAFLDRGVIAPCTTDVQAVPALHAHTPTTPGHSATGFDDLEQQSWAAFAMLSLIGTRNTGVRNLLVQLAQKPSWWSWLSGFNVDVKPVYDEAEPIVTDYGSGWRIPIEITINEDPAIYGSVDAVEPRGALELTAGIVAARGFAPNRPEHVIRAHLAAVTLNPDRGDEVPQQVSATIDWR